MHCNWKSCTVKPFTICSYCHGRTCKHHFALYRDDGKLALGHDRIMSEWRRTKRLPDHIVVVCMHCVLITVLADATPV